jgi:hypothetical protein
LSTQDNYWFICYLVEFRCKFWKLLGIWKGIRLPWHDFMPNTPSDWCWGLFFSQFS